MVRISRLGIIQTSKFSAILNAIIAVLSLIPGAVFVCIAIALGAIDRENLPLFIPQVIGLVLIPVIVAIFSFIFTGISCFAYNITAKIAGGIEVELDQA